MPMTTPGRNNPKKSLPRVLGVLFSTLPPSVCTLAYFPLWEVGCPEKLLSAAAVILLTLSTLPLMRILSAHMKTPSAPAVWLIIFIFFYMLSAIAYEMIVISFFGFVGNLIGSVFFKLAEGGVKNG